MGEEPIQFEFSPTEGFPQVAETTLKLHGWSKERRVVVTTNLKPVNPSTPDLFWDKGEERFDVLVTNLDPPEVEAFQVMELFRQRGDAEWSGATWTGALATWRAAVRPEWSIKMFLMNSKINGALQGSVHRKQS